MAEVKKARVVLPRTALDMIERSKPFPQDIEKDHEPGYRSPPYKK